MSKGSAPTPPDPVATAQAQTQSNIATATSNAALNRVNTNTPYGSLTYTTPGTNPDGTPKYQADLTLSPAQQGLLDTGTANKQALANTASGMLGTIGQTYGQPANFDNTISPEIKQAQDAAYKSQTQYLDPQFARAEDEQRTRLANQGVVQGSDAYGKATDQLAQQKQQAYQGAQNSAISAGNAEQGNLFSQMYGLRELPLNEFSALTTGSQVQQPNLPNVPGTQVANTNTAGITQGAYQDQLGAFNANQQGINNLYNLAGTLGGAALLSDRRLKRNIKYLGDTSGGFRAYSFKFKDAAHGTGTYYGVMADEVRALKPEAVTRGIDGFDRVYYGMLS